MEKLCKNLLSYLGFALLFIQVIPCNGQTIQLFVEDFESITGNYAFRLDTTFGTPVGTNSWIINDAYDGMGVYPSTTTQDSTVSGQIGGAPRSVYLHVYDTVAAANQGVANANYNPQVASDRFVAMTSGFCTLGLVDINLTFFWVGEGAPDAYAEVYYSADGGPWTRVGALRYHNQHLWKYEVITSPAFENLVDLRFGFRWVNGSSNNAPRISFGVDDIIVYGTYDNVNNPTTITINSVSPDPVCLLDNLIIDFSFSGPLCGGTYEILLSNQYGSFQNPRSLGVFNIGAGQVINGLIGTLPLPGNLPTGSCYKVRINRLSPQPSIQGTASACFEVVNCGNTITALQPPVTYGPDTVCVNSVIDVPFYSTGVYNNGNVYTAELSDSNGNFDNPTVIGTFRSSRTFDPGPPLFSDPGMVSGLVPDVPDGCNYYIRVVASRPLVIPDSSIYFFGPFCIRHCDILTNDMVDISVCISDDPNSDTTITVSYDIHQWDSIAVYFPNNQFLVQVLDAMFFQVINTGGLGGVFDTNSGTLQMTIPDLNTLISILGPPGYGSYYMRIVATNSSVPYDMLGTLIHLTIGAPSSTPSVIIPSDTFICDGQVVSFLIDPYNPDSKWQWLSNGLNNGNPFYWEYNPLLVNFSGATPGAYTFFVREENYGCFGPWSPITEVYVITPPLINISGPQTVCAGDTAHYSVPFVETTTYIWTPSSGQIIDTANNEITIIFDSAGTVDIDLFTVNICGQRTGGITVEVLPQPFLSFFGDVELCPGQSTLLIAEHDTGSVIWRGPTGIIATGDTLQISPSSTAVYTVGIETPGICPVSDTFTITVHPLPPADAGNDTTICAGDAIQLHATGGTSYNWIDDTTLSATNIPNPVATPQATTAYIVAVTDFNTGCFKRDTVVVYVRAPERADVRDSALLCLGHEIQLQAGYDAAIYQWGTSDTTPTITVTEPGEYSVRIKSAPDSCGFRIVYQVYGEVCPSHIKVPSAFTPDGDGINNYFTVFGLDIAAYEIKIFNRWGQLVYHSTNVDELNDKQKGWDGTFKGEPAEMGTYVYYIVAKTFAGEEIIRKGNLTLIR